MPETSVAPPKRRVKKRARRKLMNCLHCGSDLTRFGFFYRLRWMRKHFRRTKLFCPECRRAWYVPYP